MNQEISFYALKNTTIEKTLPKLVEKIYNSGLNIHIFCKNEDQLKLLDASLWTFSSMAFLPHGSIEDPKDTHTEHPIFLSTSQEIVNDAVVFISMTPIKIENFNRVIYFFDMYSDEGAEFEKLYKELSNSKVTYWQQTESGSWEKRS